MPAPGAFSTFKIGEVLVAGTWREGAGVDRFFETEHGTMVKFTQESQGTSISIQPRPGTRQPSRQTWSDSSIDPIAQLPRLVANGAKDRALQAVFRRPSEFILQSSQLEATNGRLDRMTLDFAGPEQYLRDDDGVRVIFDFGSGQMTSSSPGPNPYDGEAVVDEKSGLSPQQSFEAVHRALLVDPESGIIG